MSATFYDRYVPRFPPRVSLLSVRPQLVASDGEGRRDRSAGARHLACSHQHRLPQPRHGCQRYQLQEPQGRSQRAVRRLQEAGRRLHPQEIWPLLPHCQVTSRADLDVGRAQLPPA